MPPEELNKKLIDSQLNSNAEALKGASIADLVNKDSPVYKIQELPKEPVVLKEIPKFDTEGLPNLEKVRTYQGDIVNAVQHENVSMARIMMAEGVKTNDGRKPVVEEKKDKLRLHIVLGVVASILFISGVGAVAYTFFQKNKTEAPVIVVEETKDIIASDEKSKINIDGKTRAEFISAVQKELGKKPLDPTVRKISLVRIVENKEINITFPEFISLLDLRAPDAFTRNLNDEFYFGLSFVVTGNPFIIAFTPSYDLAYANILEWEKTLKDDFKEIYPAEDGKNYSFKDKIILNKDVRVLQDDAGNIIFFYSFLDQNTILFARDTDSIKAAIERLRIAKLKQ